MYVYIVTATGHNDVAYRTRNEAEAQVLLLQRLLNIQCGVMAVRGG